MNRGVHTAPRPTAAGHCSGATGFRWQSGNCTLVLSSGRNVTLAATRPPCTHRRRVSQEVAEVVTDLASTEDRLLRPSRLARRKWDLTAPLAGALGRACATSFPATVSDQKMCWFLKPPPLPSRPTAGFGPGACLTLLSSPRHELIRAAPWNHTSPPQATRKPLCRTRSNPTEMAHRRPRFGRRTRRTWLAVSRHGAAVTESLAARRARSTCPAL